MMRSNLLLAALAGTALMAAGCGSGDSDSPGSAPSTTPASASSAQVRAVHASADTGAVDILANGAVAFQGVTFGQASGAAGLPAGPARLQVNAAGTATSAIDVTVPLSTGRDYTAIALGKSGPGTPPDQAISPVLIEDPANPPASGNLKVRVVHGAPGVPAVDIYVTAPDAALPATPTIAALAYKGAAPQSGQNALEIPAGSYRVRATAAGQTALAFDSGAIALSAGSDLLLIAVPAAGSASPIALLTVPRGGAAFTVADQRAQVRVGHFSPNTPTVDVFLRAPGAPLGAGNQVVPDAIFGAASGFLAVAPGAYRASVALDGQTTEAIGLDAALAARQSVNVFAIGVLGGSGPQALRLQAYGDDLTPPASGRARLRVYHLSPDAPAVDVVVLDASGGIAARVVRGLAFPDATATYLDLAPGTYRVAVVPAGASTPLLPAATHAAGTPGVDLTLAAGDITSALAVGCLDVAAGACAGGAPFRIIALASN